VGGCVRKIANAVNVADATLASLRGRVVDARLYLPLGGSTTGVAGATTSGHACTRSGTLLRCWL
jgi:hypothetical protein